MSISVKINNIDVICTAETPSIDINKIITSFQPFKDWLKSIDTNITVKSIHFQSVDVSQKGNVLFAKFKAVAFLKNESKPIPGIILLRGGGVGCLIELICEGQSFALLVQQPRLPTGKSNFIEICAGMLDGSNNLIGVAVKEVEVFFFYYED
jgi:ADP-sugar diphosphatase